MKTIDRDALNKIIEKLGEEKLKETLNDEEVCVALEALFRKWERKIDEENEKEYVTQKVEEEFSYFAIQCAAILTKDIDLLKGVPNGCLLKLFGHRHMGYGVYAMYHQTQPFIEKGIEYTITLYRALAQYFLEYYGSFSTNELAIEMLCTYYVPTIKEQDEQLIVRALFNHITNAGTPTDYGYAHRGIKKIRKHINKLPEHMIKKLLGLYNMYHIMANPVCRHQVFTIISASEIKEKEQQKFFYIDSILLMHSISQEIYRKQQSDFEYSEWNTALCNNENIIIGQDKRSVWHWEYRHSAERELKYGEDVIVRFSLMDKRTMKLEILDKEKLEISFDYGDYRTKIYVDSYAQTFIKNKIDEILGKSKRSKGKFRFKTVWINKYRGLGEQEISLDQSYAIVPCEISSSKKIVRTEIMGEAQLETIRNQFFGESIYSISALVGANGSGKTSLLNFLREECFKILYLVNHANLTITEGKIAYDAECEVDYEYIFIFSIDDEDYFITNCDKVSSQEEMVHPYYPQPFNTIESMSKVIYFSNRIENTEAEELQIQSNKIRKATGSVKSHLKGIGFVDLSANRSFQENNNQWIEFIKEREYNQEAYLNTEAYDKFKNREFIRELAFFFSHDEAAFKSWFNLNKADLKYCAGTIEKEIDYTIDESIGEQGTALMERFLKEEYDVLSCYLCKFQYFSAGQYAKFSFLAKIYWCLEGYNKYSPIIEQFDKHLFKDEEVLLPNSNALLFIDEGELFYHPEWQRTYIDTLVKLINQYTQDRSITLQIIITSNSPFIISDIPTQNITFLPEVKGNTYRMTFGANIHQMLRDGFFMKSTIGEFAKNKILEVSKQLNDIKDKNSASQYYEQKVQIEGLIQLIGDELIKNKLQKLYHRCFDEASNKRQGAYVVKQEKDPALSPQEIKELRSNIQSLLGYIEKMEGKVND